MALVSSLPVQCTLRFTSKSTLTSDLLKCKGDLACSYLCFSLCCIVVWSQPRGSRDSSANSSKVGRQVSASQLNWIKKYWVWFSKLYFHILKIYLDSSMNFIVNIIFSKRREQQINIFHGILLHVSSESLFYTKLYKKMLRTQYSLMKKLKGGDSKTVVWHFKF